MSGGRFRSLLILATFSLAGLARGEENQLAASAVPLLKFAIQAQSSGAKAAAWLDAGLKCELLTFYGRLLPDGLSLEERKQLAADLLAPDAGDDLRRQLETFPSADRLVFDGRNYAGGNLSFIDSMLGLSGRPIAFDRELPALLVPLTPEAEAVLTERCSAFHADPETRFLRERTDQAHGRSTSPLMIGDGQFLRAYAGRFDDLYFHLFQNGNAASALAFCALEEGLAERAYRPLSGLGQRAGGGAAGFDLDDILTAGGKSAVQQYLAAQPDGPAAPFQQFAFRVLPSIVDRARTLPAGARFTASQTEILAALQSHRFLYPTRVPPLYRSPDRFLGWAGSLFIPVANRPPALPPGAADSWYPLPQRDGGDPAGQNAERGASAQLFKSSSTADIVWEDPQLSNLLSDSEKRTEVRKAVPVETRKEPRIEAPQLAEAPPAVPIPAPAKEETDPRRRATPARLIAVVTPTLEEAKDYHLAIAASDEKLRAIEQARGRLRLLREILEGVRPAAELQQRITEELDAFTPREQELAQRLQAALKERANLRVELVHRLQRERVAPLQGLGKDEAPAETKLRL